MYKRQVQSTGETTPETQELLTKVAQELQTSGTLTSATASELHTAAAQDVVGAVSVPEKEAAAKAANPKADVQSMAVTAFTDMGMKLKTAQEKAEIVTRLKMCIRDRLNGNWTTVGVYINLESKISASDYYQKYVVQAFADSGNAYAMRIGLTSGANVSSQRTGVTEYGSITSAVLNKIGAGQYSVGCKMVVYGR